MAFGNQILDKTLLQQVTQKLMRCGAGSQSHVRATVCRGEVTLTGTLRYEHERRSILSSLTCISGVRRVIDHISVELKKKSWT